MCLATGSGGVVYVTDGARTNIAGGTFKNNTADRRGGVVSGPKVYKSFAADTFDGIVFARKQEFGRAAGYLSLAVTLHVHLELSEPRVAPLPLFGEAAVACRRVLPGQQSADSGRMLSPVPDKTPMLQMKVAPCRTSFQRVTSTFNTFVGPFPAHQFYCQDVLRRGKFWLGRFFRLDRRGHVQRERSRSHGRGGYHRWGFDGFGGHWWGFCQEQRQVSPFARQHRVGCLAVVLVVSHAEYLVDNTALHVPTIVSDVAVCGVWPGTSSVCLAGAYHAELGATHRCV